MAGAQKKIVIVICTDPDATDSSSDEDEPLLKVFNNKNKRKRLVREILLPAIATDVSWLPLPIGKCQKPSVKKRKKKKETMMKKKSRYLSRGVGGGRFRKRWSEIPSSHVDRASGTASSGFGLLKDLPCLAKTPNSTITGVASSSYGRLENFPNDTTANSVASPKRSGEDEEIDKDRDEALLCFVSNDAAVEAEEEEDRGMFGESLASPSPSSLAVETKGIGLGLGELLPSLDGPSSSSSHSPLAEELDRILGLMNPGQDPVGNFSDYHPVFDASEATGGGFFDLSFDLDCDSLAWANVPEGCIA